MTEETQGETQYFTVAGLQFYAKRYGKKGGIPIIALHGWMDNSASFEMLAPKLTGCDVVCVDCAGHGHSDHRTHLGAYNIWQDIAEIFSIADQLGWAKFALLGHSRGAICSFLAAGTLPERISHLLLIEGIYPPLSTNEETPEVLAVAVRALLASQTRNRRYYEHFDQAVKARENGFMPVSHEDAKALALHGTQKTAEGYSWRYDQRLGIGSEVRLNFEQLMAFQQRIQAPVLLILAKEGILLSNPKAMSALAAFDGVHTFTLPGDHHLHMHAQCEQVAEYIRSFLLGQ